MYAEALNEKGEDYATVLPWIDMVRERSGLQGVKESWDQYVETASMLLRLVYDKSSCRSVVLS